jgi:hypothetical protein
VIAPVIVVLDAAPNCALQLPRAVVVVELHHVLRRPRSAASRNGDCGQSPDSDPLVEPSGGKVQAMATALMSSTIRAGEAPSDVAEPSAAPDAMTSPLPPQGTARRTGRNRYPSWADLLRRAWAVDVLACRACGGLLRLLATIRMPPWYGVSSPVLASPRRSHSRCLLARRPTSLVTWPSQTIDPIAPRLDPGAPSAREVASADRGHRDQRPNLARHPASRADSRGPAPLDAPRTA